MSDEKKSKKVLFPKFFEKLKAVKHVEVFISIIFIAIILLIYFSTNTGQAEKGKIDENINLTSTLEYTKEIENKVEKVLSKISGAGKVSVVVNCLGGYKLEIAYTTETIKKTENSNPTETTTKTPVLITNNGETSPVVLGYILPKIENVIIVATGAKDTNVKLELVRAVESLLGVPSSSIEVFSGN